MCYYCKIKGKPGVTKSVVSNYKITESDSRRSDGSDNHQLSYYTEKRMIKIETLISKV